MSSTDRILSIIRHDYEYAQWNETESASASASEIAEVILQCIMRQFFFFDLESKGQYRPAMSPSAVAGSCSFSSRS